MPPQKVTLERSGNLRLASPLTCSGWARATEAPKVKNRNNADADWAMRCELDATLCKPMRMGIPPILTYHDDYAFRPIPCGGFLMLDPVMRTFRIRTRFHRK